MRRVAVRILILGVGVLIALGAVAAWAVDRYVSPGPLKEPATLIIPRGIGVDGIARRLAEAGVIDNRLLFTLAARLGGDRALQAGEYAFAPGMSARGVMELLRSGRTVVRRLTIAEGLTTAQVLDGLRSADGLEETVSPIPGEGELLPETYHYSYGHDRNRLIERMRRAMDETLVELWATRAPGLPFDTPREALVLASIVEKETAVPEERARIAAVFINRLRRGMRLQSDPTVVYALTDGERPLDRPLGHADLEIDSPYNTYVVDGLPPGPICNPGRASIRAVLNPLETDELYFVADGSGGHVFSRTLEEHNRNVRRWRNQNGQSAEKEK